jgi:cytochrome c-type biogenesis protein CcmE
LKKKRLIIVGIVVLAALIYIGYIAFSTARTYYITVSQLKADIATYVGQKVQVRGILESATQQSTSGKPSWQFVLADQGQVLAVAYQGATPDALKVGNELIVQGRLDNSGVFQGQTIITKCPSKYEPAQ